MVAAFTIHLPVILQNERILLRPVIPADLDALTAISADPEMWVWFTHDLSDPAIMNRWLSDAITEASGGSRIAFTVVEKTSGSVAGCTSFGNFSERDMRAEIGWTFLGKDFRGRGINRDMKYLILEYGFENLGLERIESKTDVLNIPARKGLEKSGMKEEGILRSHTLMTGQRRRDTIFYSILRSEWPAVRNSYLGWQAKTFPEDT